MGGFLTIGYCLRIIRYCFPYCFLEIFVGRDKALMEGDKVMMGGSPNSSLGKTLIRNLKLYELKIWHLLLVRWNEGVKFQGQLKRLYEENIAILLLLMNHFIKNYLTDGCRTIPRQV